MKFDFLHNRTKIFAPFFFFPFFLLSPSLLSPFSSSIFVSAVACCVFPLRLPRFLVAAFSCFPYFSSMRPPRPCPRPRTRSHCPLRSLWRHTSSSFALFRPFPGHRCQHSRCCFRLLLLFFFFCFFLCR